MKLAVLLMGLALLVGPAVLASGEATPDDARAMALRAAAYLQANGPEKALPEFNARDGAWHDRDLFVTVRNARGVMVAHGSDAELVGSSVLDLKDGDGKPFNHEIRDVKDAAWISFKWRNPISRTLESKTQYNVRVGDYIVGVSAYAR
jgi:signal transduction histidine kinase